eukprot:3841290-Lingulodinium_polyedra.AAC.1
MALEEVSADLAVPLRAGCRREVRQGAQVHHEPSQRALVHFVRLDGQQEVVRELVGVYPCAEKGEGDIELASLVAEQLVPR